MHAQIKEFIEQFELLSSNNATLYNGIKYATLLELFRKSFPSSENDNDILSELIKTLKNRFSAVEFKKYKSKVSKDRIKYCTLQPCNPDLWNYLWSKPSQLPTQFAVRYSKTTCSFSECDYEICDDIVVQPQEQTNIALVETNYLQEVELQSMSEMDIGTNKEQLLEKPTELQVDEQCITPCKSTNSEDETLEECLQVTKQKLLNCQQELTECKEKLNWKLSPPPARQEYITRSITKWFSTSISPMNTILSKSSTKQSKLESILSNVPKNVKTLLAHIPIHSRGIDLSKVPPLYMTEEQRHILMQQGFVTIPNVINLDLIEELKRYILLKYRSEKIDQQSYLYLCKAGNNLGLISQHGWTKIEFNGPVQQLLSAVPALYLCMAELLGHTRLMTNLYEYKVCFSRGCKRSHNSENKIPKFEFTHVDGNLKLLRYAVAAGLPIELFYQVIVPLTPMKPGSTVYFAQGFHLVWEQLVQNAIDAKRTTRNGWKSTNPLHFLTEEDGCKYIEDVWISTKVNPGEILIFNALLPHSPDINTSGNTRMAAYPFYAPLITEQDPLQPHKAESFLPNSLSEIRDSISHGSCPLRSAHPWCDNILPSLYKNFFPALPYTEIPRTPLADCLFGFKTWSEFEKSEEAKYLYGLSPLSLSLKERFLYVTDMAKPLLSTLQNLNKGIEQKIFDHETHDTEQYCNGCEICDRYSNAKFVDWWHSTDAARHDEARLTGCSCIRCKEALELGWCSWRDIGGCTCPFCYRKN